ncbi:hypothetical protein BDB00DRAFT_556202 [Zychaea mexicana]|uniref:uncharacterized protein n=1 Tax=Zychaea mexicana TaxID=64656 RepID=UPI0022FEA86D|nr:uncharacterized protein BDB00DRAFT_556202 [Zychaea mexicana]KAI9490448.1 hypothetical protein BDB00DRAFT_556202 [Zychaea mexicana]
MAQTNLFSFFKKKDEAPTPAPASVPKTAPVAPQQQKQKQEQTSKRNIKPSKNAVADTATESLAIAEPMVIDSGDHEDQDSDNDDYSPVYSRARRTRKRTTYAISDSDDDPILNSPCAPGIPSLYHCFHNNNLHHFFGLCFVTITKFISSSNNNNHGYNRL